VNKWTCFAAGVLLLSAFACSKHKVRGGEEIGPGGSPEQSGLRIEVVWVDPTIVESDQQMTLIRSDRIDSIEVAPDEINRPAAPAISFEIADRSCWTSAAMLDARGKELQSLLHKQLAPGFYKLTLHKPPPAANPGIPYRYSLQVRSCGEVKTVQIGSGQTSVR
jgi:hypothetical protein